MSGKEIKVDIKVLVLNLENIFDPYSLIWYNSYAGQPQEGKVSF